MLPEGMRPYAYVMGPLWTLTYVFIIIRGFRDRTYGMPPVALSANLAWEFIFSTVLPHPTPSAEISGVWLAFDVIILVQYLKFWSDDYPAGLSRKLFWWCYPPTIPVAGVLIYYLSIDAGDRMGLHAAWGMNFMMSVMFIFMLQRRPDLRGHTFYGSIAKCLGSSVMAVGQARFPQPGYPERLHVILSALIFTA